jgi:hypothetical protein
MVVQSFTIQRRNLSIIHTSAKLVRETFVSLGEKDAQIAIFAEFEVQKVRSS